MFMHISSSIGCFCLLYFVEFQKKFNVGYFELYKFISFTYFSNVSINTIRNCIKNHAGMFVFFCQELTFNLFQLMRDVSVLVLNGNILKEMLKCVYQVITAIAYDHRNRFNPPCVIMA